MNCSTCGWQLIRGACANGTCSTRSQPASSRRRNKRRQPFAATSLSARPSPGKIATQYAAILKALEENGGPMTRDALEDTTTLRINVVTPRVDELLKTKRLVEPGTTAKTRSGRQAKLLALASQPVETAGRLAL